MFTSRLPDFLGHYDVVFADYAERNFRKNFAKKYKGKIWEVTEQSILADLRRIHVKLQLTQQVDELFHRDDFWLFKYDFAVAKSGKSAKSSGNRCICLLNERKKKIDILLIYHKDYLPKNMRETQYIKQEVGKIIPELGWR